MITSKYIIKGRNLEKKISEFVRDFNRSAYESSYMGGFIRVIEDSSFFNKNNYMVFIRVDTTESETRITRVEVISGGADDKILIQSIFGGDKRRVKQFAMAFQEFCKEQFIDYSSE
ncbi:MAG: hypothetical protein WBC06_10820 [Chitinophagaceae bacterium]